MPGLTAPPVTPFPSWKRPFRRAEEIFRVFPSICLIQHALTVKLVIPSGLAFCAPLEVPVSRYNPVSFSFRKEKIPGF